MLSEEKMVSFFISPFSTKIYHPKVLWFDMITISAYLHAIMESKQEEDHETYEKRTADMPKEAERNASSEQPLTPLPPYK